MKKVKLLLAASLLCASQFAMAFATQAEIDAYNTALLNLTVAQQQGTTITQAMVDAVVNAAATAGIALSTLTTSLNSAGVAPAMITSAVSTNVGLGGGCSPNCGVARTGTATYAAGSTGVVTTTLTGLSSSPTGFGTTTTTGGGTTQTLSFTPPTCSGVSKC